MVDYRKDFYKKYHLAIQSKNKADHKRYADCIRQFAGRWQKWLPTDKSAACLDIGCGCGEFLYFLRYKGFIKIYGIDLNPVEIDVASQVGLPNLVSGDIFDYLSEKRELFDLITAFHFFEHLKKAEAIKLLDMIYKALKPNGRLLAVTPNGLSPFGGATRYWDFSHETGFTPASWRQIAYLAGFREVIFEEYGPIPHSVLGAIRSVLWRCVSLGIQVVSYVEVGSPRDKSRVYTADMKIILVK